MYEVRARAAQVRPLLILGRRARARISNCSHEERGAGRLPRAVPRERSVV
jgi:hypothetical protein